MKTKNILVPVKKVLKMINTCEDTKQIEGCKTVISNYIKAAKKNGVVNYEDLQSRLEDELIERQEALDLVKIFNKHI